RRASRAGQARSDQGPLVAEDELLDQRHIRVGRRSGATACGLTLLQAGGRCREAAGVGVAAVAVGRIATQQIERRDVAVRGVTERAVVRKRVVEDRVPPVVKQAWERGAKQAE